jgi:hydroxypyruvate reductase
MKPAIVLGTKLRPGLVARLADRYTVLDPGGLLTPASLPAGAAEARALVTVGTLQTPRALIEALPRLGLIACFGTGYEGVDRAAARERGIALTHSPGANSSAVADHAMALVLTLAHRVIHIDRFVRDGGWTEHPAVGLAAVPGLTGRKFGVYGLGIIGAKIAARAAAFEMQVAYHNRTPRADVPYAYHDSLLNLAAWADILMVAARAGPANRHAVNAEVLTALGPKGLVFNIARGFVIDEAALVAALEGGVIAGAGLDVYENEPRVPDALKALGNVVLSPHRGGSTETAQAAMQSMVLGNLEAFFAGKPLLSPVSG